MSFLAFCIFDTSSNRSCNSCENVVQSAPADLIISCFFILAQASASPVLNLDNTAITLAISSTPAYPMRYICMLFHQASNLMRLPSKSPGSDTICLNNLFLSVVVIAPDVDNVRSGLFSSRLASLASFSLSSATYLFLYVSHCTNCSFVSNAAFPSLTPHCSTTRLSHACLSNVLACGGSTRSSVGPGVGCLLDCLLVMNRYEVPNSNVLFLSSSCMKFPTPITVFLDKECLHALPIPLLYVERRSQPIPLRLLMSVS